MKPLSFSKKELLIMLLIMPPIGIAVNYLLFGHEYFSNLSVFLKASVPTIAVLLLVYVCCGMVAGIMLNRFPKYSQTFRRIGLSLPVYIVITVTGITIIFLGYDYLSFLGYEINWNKYAWALVVGTASNVLATSLNEGAAFFEKWRHMVDEAEALRSENLASQLEGLKGQVNPHFLFNSLNSLSSLIADDPEQAEKFLDEMSKVYRYMLRNNEDGLTSLDAELQFVQSYFHMLKTRYGDGVQLTVSVDEHYMQFMMPPFTLQMLVENAVKHNMILKENPLQIIVMTTNSGMLIVSNNLQRKTRNVPSNKIGLSNISKKYQLLKQPEIAVQDDGKEFTVSVPLLHP